MKPNNNLILAWKEYLNVHQQGRVATAKSDVLFRHSVTNTGIDAKLYNRASELHKYGLVLHRHALALWRKALKAEYDKRYRIQWRDYQTCVVWVHEPYKREEEQLHFNKSMRLKKN